MHDHALLRLALRLNEQVHGAPIAKGFPLGEPAAKNMAASRVGCLSAAQL
jgi:hypothetical protein